MQAAFITNAQHHMGPDHFMSSNSHKKSYQEQQRNPISSAFVLLLWDSFVPSLRPAPLSSVKCSLSTHNALLTPHQTHRQNPFRSGYLGSTT